MVRLPSPFGLVLAHLWPKDLMQDNCSDHHREDEKVRENQKAGHDAPDDLDGMGIECIGDCEGRGTEGRVGEHKGVPSHCELEFTVADTGPVRKDGDEEEPDCQSNY